MRATVLAAALLLPATPIAAQQACTEVEAVILQCPDGEGISGEPPACQCNGAPVDMELSCAVNFGCADSSQTGDGTWPECFCRVAEEVVPPGGGDGGGTGTGVGGGLGGEATCEQFFECPSGSEMEVIGGQCSCTLVMLPAVEE